MRAKSSWSLLCCVLLKYVCHIFCWLPSLSSRAAAQVFPFDHLPISATKGRAGLGVRANEDENDLMNAVENVTLESAATRDAQQRDGDSFLLSQLETVNQQTYQQHV